MEKPRPSTLAWVGLAASVAAYDILCPEGETMSEGVDRALETRVGRVLALGAIAVTSCHLANILPQRYDPFHQALKWRIMEKAIEETL